MPTLNGSATFAGAGAFTGNAGSTFLVKSYSPGAERNDFTGQVGMMFIPTADLLVSQLGLRCGTGNTGNHTVSLYAWNGGAPIGPLLRTATVSLTGGTIGTFYYGSVSAITLSKDIAYAVVTTVTNGDGQSWGVEAATQVNDAVTVWSTFTSDGVTFTLANPDDQFAGVDISFKASNYTHLISSFASSFAPPRNDFTGQVGVVFTPTADITFNTIGLRMASGDTGSHTVNLYNWGSGGNPIGSLLATATVSLTGGLVGQYYYSPISSVTLSHGSMYALVSPVTNGDGQFWAAEGRTTLWNAGNPTGTFTVDSTTFSTSAQYAQFLGVDLNLIDVLGSFAGAGNFTAVATVIGAAQDTFAGTGNFTARATATFAAQQQAFAGAGTFTANATAQLAARATFAGIGGVTANASVLTIKATFAGAGGFAANATVTFSARAVFAGSGSFAANGNVQIAGKIGAATFAGAGNVTAAALPQRTGVGNFNGVGAFTANARIQNPAQAAFAGAGSFSATATQRLSAVAAFQGTGAFAAISFDSSRAGFAAFAGTGRFIARPVIMQTPIITLALPNGRWSPVFDSNGSFYPPLGAPTLVPAPGENGFTLYFISGAATHPLPSGCIMMLTAPDGTLIPIDQPAYYTGYDDIFDFNRGAGAFAAYVTHGTDIGQVGVWQMQLKNASNQNLSGVGYFNVAA